MKKIIHQNLQKIYAYTRKRSCKVNLCYIRTYIIPYFSTTSIAEDLSPYQNIQMALHPKKNIFKLLAGLPATHEMKRKGKDSKRKK